MLRKVLKLALIGLVVVFVGIQLVPVDRTNPPVQGRMPASPQAQDVLRRACYDCHSNETTWPWYSHVAPISWWLAGHVEDGRTELNFSEWTGSATPQQLKKVAKIPKEIAKGNMPPWYYRLGHPEARHSATDAATLKALAAAAAAPAAYSPAPTTR
jgi:hypothetical protein